MAAIENSTPHASAFALFIDARGANVASIVVKASYTIPDKGSRCEPSVNRHEVFGTDQHWDDSVTSSVRLPADLILGKPGTDIGVCGSIVTANGEPATESLGAVRVGPAQMAVRAIGERRFTGGLLGRATTTPESFVRMPLRFERTYGGLDSRGRPFPTNPHGVGANPTPGSPAPNLVRPDAPAADLPWCPGFVAASASPRRDFAGTYDEAWQREHCPLLPSDFRLDFFAAAVPPLHVRGGLHGGESVSMLNLGRPGRRDFCLPTDRPAIRCRFVDRVETLTPSLWTVVLEPDEGRVTLTWGQAIDVGLRPSSLCAIEVRDVPLSSLS